MRLKLGRPDIARYSDRFDVPAAGPGALSVTWLGVATLLLDDGSSALMTDGYFSRPGLARVAAGKVSPSPARVDGCLARAKVSRLEAVIPVHTHIDHVLDSALVADRTGAQLVGGESAANVGRGYGLPEDRLVVAACGEPIALGAYDVTLVESHHCPPDRFPGVINAPLIPPVQGVGVPLRGVVVDAGAPPAVGPAAADPGQRRFRQAARWPATAPTPSTCPSASWACSRRPYLIDYWTETVRAVGARRVILIHWDDFFRPLSKPLRALPYAGDDLDVSIRILDELAAQDGVALHLPTVWRRENPWA